MKVSFSILALLLPAALAQTVGQECTRDLIRTDDCTDVIDANACYNKNGFRNAQTLTCIAGKDDADKKRKACKCCSCVGKVMCDWVKKSNYC